MPKSNLSLLEEDRSNVSITPVDRARLRRVLRNLFHINTQEEAEQHDYQRLSMAYSGNLGASEKEFGTRGAMHLFATDTDDPAVGPRFRILDQKMGEAVASSQRGFIEQLGEGCDRCAN